MTAQTVKLRNSADHWFVPGDSGQTVVLGDTEYTVASVMAASEDVIMTYGLRLIPAEVTLVLESDEPAVVQ